jgi:hypothetical protein
LSVERCEPNLPNLALLCFERILVGPEAELCRALVFRSPPNPMLDVFSIDPKFLSVRYSTEGNVSMRVLSIRVDNCNPFQAAPEVRLHAGHHFADELREVNTLTELWRDDQLEQPAVSGRLPSP